MGLLTVAALLSLIGGVVIGKIVTPKNEDDDRWRNSESS